MAAVGVGYGGRQPGGRGWERGRGAVGEGPCFCFLRMAVAFFFFNLFWSSCSLYVAGFIFWTFPESHIHPGSIALP